MDKVKQEIDKILEDLTHKHCQNCNGNNEPYIPSQDEKNIDTASSSLTALIIKWLEGKKQNKDYAGSGGDKWMWEELRKEGRNQLITELIGELEGTNLC